MSRVLLISTNLTVEPYPVYPLGMAIVAGALERAGHTVRQVDLLAAGDDGDLLERELASFEPEVVGISLRNIDNIDSFVGEEAWYLDQAQRTVARVRAASAAPILVGGPGFTIMPEAILDFVGADIGVVGEGERLVPQIVADLERGESVERLYQASAQPLTGPEFGRPLREQVLVDFYQAESGLLNLQTKRGCPFRCSYCTYPAIEGSRFRVRDPRDVVAELREARQQYGIERVFFCDSIFNDAQGRYLELAEAMLASGLEIAWSAYFRPQGTTPEQFRLLQRAGLEAVEFGTDAASDATLDGLDKGFAFDDVVRAQASCSELGIPAAHFIIFGGPGETEQTLAAGLANIEALGRCVVFGFSGIRILPGTGIAQRALQDGLIDDDTDLLRPRYYLSPQIDQEQMNGAILQSFKGRPDRIFPPSEGQKKIEVMRRFGYRGLLWDQLLKVAGRERRRSRGRRDD